MPSDGSTRRLSLRTLEVMPARRASVAMDMSDISLANPILLAMYLLGSMIRSCLPTARCRAGRGLERLYRRSLPVGWQEGSDLQGSRVDSTFDSRVPARS